MSLIRPNQFSDISILQGSVAVAAVAIRLRCGGIFSDHFIANFLGNATMKEF